MPELYTLGIDLYPFSYDETAKPANHRHPAYQLFDNFRVFNGRTDSDTDPRLQARELGGGDVH